MILPKKSDPVIETNFYEQMDLCSAQLALIFSALKRNNGSTIKAAKSLGVTPQKIYDHLKRYGYGVKQWNSVSLDSFLPKD